MPKRSTRAGVTVQLFDDPNGSLPDSVFPNNWFSTHTGGRIALYPMYSPSRRGERRADVVELLKRRYRVQDVIDYSGLEYDNIFLEGTGAMVLDHTNRVAYAARSHRADPLALERFCATFGYEPMMFDAADASGLPIYHTNVMMCIATDFALIGLDMITSPERRAEVADRLTEPGRTIIPLSDAQIHDFAGNAIELRGCDGAHPRPVEAGRRQPHGCPARGHRGELHASSRSMCPPSSSPAARCAACWPASISTGGPRRPDRTVLA